MICMSSLKKREEGMTREVIFKNYPMFVSDLRRTLFIRFGVKVKPSQIVRDFDGSTKIHAEMTDDQYSRIIKWRDGV